IPARFQPEQTKFPAIIGARWISALHQLALSVLIAIGECLHFEATHGPSVFVHGAPGDHAGRSFPRCLLARCTSSNTAGEHKQDDDGSWSLHVHTSRSTISQLIPCCPACRSCANRRVGI